MLKQTITALRRAPGFATIAILSIGLAIAVNTSLFGFVDALINPFQPYANADRVFSTYTTGGDRRRPIAPKTQERALREGLQSADETAPFVAFSSLVSGNGNAEDGLVVAASPNLFELLGVKPEAGRSFQSIDGSGNAVISYAVWNEWFQRRPIEDGLTLTVGSAAFHVVGVMPRGVHFPLVTSVWISMADLPREIFQNEPSSEIAFRLRPGATAESARRELNATLQNLANEFGQNRAAGAILIPLHVRAMPFANFELTLAIAGLVLVIACANLGTMMLARGAARRREIAIRIALGAGRRAIWAEVLAECAVLAVCGVAVGMLLTLWAMDVLPHVAANQVPLLGDVRPQPSWRVFAVASLACALIIVLAGWLPGARAATTDPAEALKDGSTTTGRRRDRYNPLLIVQVAVSAALLTTAGLYAEFSSSLASFHFSYDADRLIVADVKADSPIAPTAVPQFYHDALGRLGRLSKNGDAATRYFAAPDHGVITAEAGSAGNPWMNLSRVAIVSPEYLRTLSIPVVDGRDFDPGDQTGKSAVVIVDQLAARMLWPNDRSPVGHLVKMGPAESRAPWLRVVGVARRTELEPRADPDLPPEAQMYTVLPDDPTRDREVVVRGGSGSRADQSALAVSVRRELQVLAPWMGGAHVVPWLEKYDKSVGYTAFLATAFGAFGLFGLTLCAVGLFGVAAYTVSRRSRELALRIALGASTGHIVRIVLHDAGVMVLAGMAVAAPATLWATRGLRDGLSTTGYQLPIALLAAECVLVVVAFAASYRPLRRATRADPVEVLRAN
jgi:predicted permease